MFLIIYPFASIIIVGFFIFRSKLKRKKHILGLFIGSALLQCATIFCSNKVYDYTTNYQNEYNTCPSTQGPWSLLLEVVGIVSLILAISALVLTIKDKKPLSVKLLPIILLAVAILLFGFATFMMAALSSFCVTF